MVGLVQKETSILDSILRLGDYIKENEEKAFQELFVKPYTAEPILFLTPSNLEEEDKKDPFQKIVAEPIEFTANPIRKEFLKRLDKKR